MNLRDRDQVARVGGFVKNLIRKYPLLLALVWALIIFILCATPGQYIPSANWLDLLSVDKLVHAGIFFVLSFLLFAVMFKYNQSKAMLYVYLVTAILYGISLELMQAYIFSNRTADWKDVMANSFGCLITLFFLNRIRKFVIA